MENNTQMQQENKQKRLEIETGQMFLDTYTYIATWNNIDYETTKQKQEALKAVSNEIVQNIIDKVFNNLDGVNNVTMKVTRGNMDVQQTAEQIKKESFADKNEKDVISKLFDKK
jgi:hypothetical protein